MIIVQNTDGSLDIDTLEALTASMRVEIREVVELATRAYRDGFKDGRLSVEPGGALLDPQCSCRAVSIVGGIGGVQLGGVKHTIGRCDPCDSRGRWFDDDHAEIEEVLADLFDGMATDIRMDENAGETVVRWQRRLRAVSGILRDRGA